MVEERHYITSDGLKKVEKELEYLRHVKRPQVAERLHNALQEGGELGEDAEYEDAKNEQAFVEGEIARLEIILSNAVIISANASTDEVSIGNRITLREKGMDEDEIYDIVGEAEADPDSGKISYKSPIGSALMGHKLNDEVKVNVPDGQITFVIRAIE